MSGVWCCGFNARSTGDNMGYGLRQTNFASVAATNDSATTQRLGYTGARGGGFVVTSLSTAASVSFLVTAANGGTLADLKDNNNQTISINLTAGDAYEIPPEAFGFAEVAFLCNAGSAVLEVSVKN